MVTCTLGILHLYRINRYLLIRFYSKMQVFRSRSLFASKTLLRFASSSAPKKNFSVDDDSGEVTIKVQPIPRPNEPIETKRRRLQYQSRKRGILESDLLLSRYADKYLESMTLEELEEYDKLLDEPDWDIYYWATKNYEVTPLPERWATSKILKKLQEMSENSERDVLRMPDIKVLKE